MKYTNIDKHPLLRKESLDPNHYTIALLEEGRRLALIDQTCVDNIQAEAMLILAELIIKYNHGESSSLRAALAQNILMSIFYALDACLGSFSDPQEALDLLKTSSLTAIYTNGLDLVETALTECRQLYQDIANNRLLVPIEAYNATIDKALPGFFKNYDVIYSAQDTVASIDYPLLFDDMRKQGVFYIQEYLIKLKIETQFCHLFTPQDLHRLLFHYGQINRFDYRETLFNLFEIVLTNAIFSVLAGNSARELHISEYQYERLRKQLRSLDHAHLSLLISTAIKKLLNELHIIEPQLKEYIVHFNSLLMPRFLKALENDSLTNLIIIYMDRPRSEIVFDEGERLNDDDFRKVVNEILDCSDTTDKVSIINARIRSLADYIDLLEADCLFADEHAALFSALGDMELSVLARIVFIEEIRTQSQSFSVQNLPLISPEMQWQIEYVIFLQGLNQERLNAIDHFIQSSFLTDSWAYLE